MVEFRFNAKDHKLPVSIPDNTKDLPRDEKLKLATEYARRLWYGQRLGDRGDLEVWEFCMMAGMDSTYYDELVAQAKEHRDVLTVEEKAQIFEVLLDGRPDGRVQGQSRRDHARIRSIVEQLVETFGYKPTRSETTDTESAAEILALAGITQPDGQFYSEDRIQKVLSKSKESGKF